MSKQGANPRIVKESNPNKKKATPNSLMSKTDCSSYPNKINMLIILKTTYQ